jgi:glycerate 2-kinase
VSAIKAGRLALAAAPATIVNLTICDVAGCSEDLITDPTVADSSTREQAVEVMRAYHLWDTADDEIKRHLMSASATSPSLEAVEIQTEVIVDGYQICEKMAETVMGLGREPIVLGDSLATDARCVGALVAGMAKTSVRHSQPFPARSVVVGCGGESTVTFDSGEALFGAGGPNQELILSAALELDATDQVALLAIDTDGHDGGTTHAGAIADGLTASRARAAGVDIRSHLFAHRSAFALTALKDHIVTGPTGTNVNDLVVVALGH